MMRVPGRSSVEKNISFWLDGSFMSSFGAVGVGVLVLQGNCILLGERLDAHGAGTWAPPGGHLEFGETPEDCAKRELREETNLRALKVRRGPWCNNIFEAKHYVTLLMIVDSFEGEFKAMEPDKCKQWRWFAKNELPENLFAPLATMIEMFGIEQLMMSA